MMTVATVSLDSSGNFWDQRDSSWMSGVRTSRSWSVWEAAEEKKTRGYGERLDQQ